MSLQHALFSVPYAQGTGSIHAMIHMHDLLHLAPSLSSLTKEYPSLSHTHTHTAHTHTAHSLSLSKWRPSQAHRNPVQRAQVRIGRFISAAAAAQHDEREPG